MKEDKLYQELLTVEDRVPAPNNSKLNPNFPATMPVGGTGSGKVIDPGYG